MAAPTYSVGQVLAAADCNTWFTPRSAGKSSAQNVTSSTTLVNDSALFVTVDANAQYFFHLYINYLGGTAGASDLKWGFTFPSGATMRYAGNYLSTGLTVQVGATHIQTDVVAAGTNGGGNNLAVDLHGTVFTSSTSGTLQLQWAQNTSSATSTTVGSGSALILTRIGP
jgi:hypothetical protein